MGDGRYGTGVLMARPRRLMPDIAFIDKLRDLAGADGRYDWRAFQFLYEGLTYTVRKHRREAEAGADRHVSGRELAEGLRELALRAFGFLAFTVWESWGIRATADWGEIVFLLVEEEFMNKSENDRVEDFADVYPLESMERDYFAENLYDLSLKPWPGTEPSDPKGAV